jgi:hypothetical protein
LAIVADTRQFGAERLAGSTASEMSQIADTARTRSRALAERHASIKVVR